VPTTPVAGPRPPLFGSASEAVADTKGMSPQSMSATAGSTSLHAIADDHRVCPTLRGTRVPMVSAAVVAMTPVATDRHSSQSAAAVKSSRCGHCRGLVAPSHLSGRRMSDRLARILWSVEEYAGMDRCAKKRTLIVIHEHSALASERLLLFG